MNFFLLVQPTTFTLTLKRFLILLEEFQKNSYEFLFIIYTSILVRYQYDYIKLAMILFNVLTKLFIFVYI